MIIGQFHDQTCSVTALYIILIMSFQLHIPYIWFSMGGSKLLLALLLIFLFSTPVLSQTKKKSIVESGYFSLSRRASVSMWGLNEWKPSGLGSGTSMRLQISKRFTTESYGDFIKTQYKGDIYRIDRHLTTSLMYYFRKLDTLKYKFHPFVSASVFCLDFTKLEEVGPNGKSLERFSLSQQIGLGTHFFLSERCDLSIYAQYYNHLGNDIHIHEHDDGTYDLIAVRDRISLEGHMFFVFSVGYRVGDLWGKKK